MRMEDKITLRREIVMQENAAKIRVKTGNSGAFTEKIKKKSKNFSDFFQKRLTLIVVRDIMYRLSFEELLFGRAVSENPELSLRSQSKKED